MMDWVVYFVLCAMGADDFQTREVASGVAVIVEAFYPGRVQAAENKNPSRDPEVRRRIALLPEIPLFKPLTNLKIGAAYRLRQNGGTTFTVYIISVDSVSRLIFYSFGAGYSQVVTYADGWPKFTAIR